MKGGEKMPDYVVEWQIELRAENPQEAAQEALDIQRDSGSLATVFNVIQPGGTICRVDLEEEYEGEEP